jgi:hypothetical protein
VTVDSFFIQKPANHPDDFGREERLGNNGLILTQGLKFAQDVRPARGKHNRDARIVASHKPTDRNSVPLSWHVDIRNEQSKGDCRALNDRCCFVATRRLTNRETSLGKLLSQEQTDQSFIFNKENAQGFHGPPSGAPLSLGLTYWPPKAFITPALSSTEVQQ